MGQRARSPSLFVPWTTGKLSALTPSPLLVRLGALRLVRHSAPLLERKRAGHSAGRSVGYLAVQSAEPRLRNVEPSLRNARVAPRTRRATRYL